MRRLLLVAAAVAALGAPESARAATCDTLPGPVVYLQVGDTQLNLMKRLGRKLRDNTPNPVTLVFTTSGSCVNIDNFYNHTAAITTTMQYIPSTAENAAWDPKTSPTLTCTPPGSGVFPDIGNSALFVSSCTNEAAPATVQAVNGPVQGYVMAVPKASSQTAITFEEAYFVFGFGMAGMVTPWVDETQMFIRTITKSTLLTWAANISVPGAKWHGMMFDGSPMVVSALQNTTSPESAIGILGAEVYDANRSTLTELAFRAKDQYAAYFADSTSTATDKQNVRDGHYTVWSPTVWMYNTDGAGNATNANAKYVVDMIAGHPVTPAPNFAPDQIVAGVGLVPECAMRVQRSFDGGPLSLYKPATSCVCRFLAAAATTTCTACTDPDGTACSGGGVCRGNGATTGSTGYCEEF